MKISKIILCAVCAISLIACDDKQSENNPTPLPTNAIYIGNMVVDQNDGSSFTCEDLLAEFKLNNNGTMDIILAGAQFAAAMPLEIDMTIPSISYTTTDNGYTIAGSNIIPLAMGGEFPMFTISVITGTITSESMSLDFMCGQYPVVYNGTSTKLE